MNYAEFLAECENCGQFFVKTNRRFQRFCKSRGERACRDEYDREKRKTPEGRKERAAYTRRLRATKRWLKKGKEKKRDREMLEQIPE